MPTDKRDEAREYLEDLLGEVGKLVQTNASLIAQNRALVQQLSALNSNMVTLQQRMDLAHDSLATTQAVLVRVLERDPRDRGLIGRLQDALAPPVQPMQRPPPLTQPRYQGLPIV